MKENGPSGLRAKTVRRFADVARAEPFWWYKAVGSPLTRAGVPDFLCTYAGRFGALELKGDGGTLSVAQKGQIGKIALTGSVVMIATSMEEVEAFLDAMRMYKRESDGNPLHPKIG